MPIAALLFDKAREEGRHRELLDVSRVNAAEQRLRASAYAAGPEVSWRFWAGNVGVRRASWERVGPYDTDFRAYGWEDVDWGYRLHTAGIPIVVDPALETGAWRWDAERVAGLSARAHAGETQ